MGPTCANNFTPNKIMILSYATLTLIYLSVSLHAYPLFCFWDISDGDFNDEAPDDPTSYGSIDKGETTASPDKLSTGT